MCFFSRGAPREIDSNAPRAARQPNQAPARGLCERARARAAAHGPRPLPKRARGCERPVPSYPEPAQQSDAASLGERALSFSPKPSAGLRRERTGQSPAGVRQVLSREPLFQSPAALLLLHLLFLRCAVPPPIASFFAFLLLFLPALLLVARASSNVSLPTLATCWLDCCSPTHHSFLSTAGVSSLSRCLFYAFLCGSAARLRRRRKFCVVLFFLVRFSRADYRARACTCLCVGGRALSSFHCEWCPGDRSPSCVEVLSASGEPRDGNPRSLKRRAMHLRCTCEQQLSRR